MVETDGAYQCQVIEVLMLEADRFVSSRRYVDIKFMYLCPWLVIKVMVHDSSYNRGLVQSHILQLFLH